jgi:DNA polymerase zeta
MVKTTMKSSDAKADKALHRVLNARQFGLKLIANVTYGYTGASFSGRMPCAEIADAIVQTARDTLERAINLVESDPIWKAKVVYGDTDSMFVLLEGRSREEAFRIGAEIAARVTASNPRPVKLQMEKVYHPCTLISKKRYVGYMYESPHQKEPTLDAKGIETVRRDTCPAVAKMMDNTIRMLFDQRDLSNIRYYLERQWYKIMSGRLPIHDLMFAKEVRLGSYRLNAALPPAALIATKMMAADPRAEALYGVYIPTFLPVYAN